MYIVSIDTFVKKKIALCKKPFSFNLRILNRIFTRMHGRNIQVCKCSKDSLTFISRIIFDIL